MANSKQIIIDLFKKNVQGKKADTHGSNVKHDGKVGHWLETQMGISHNASNAPDIGGYEMKNETGSKTTFGDWSPDIHIWDTAITRDDFLRIFGKANIKKGNRYSWSGEPVPKINKWNTYGQKLIVAENNNILAVYNYKKDLRPIKNYLIPKKYKHENVILAQWSANIIKNKLEKKFNQKGWFKCKTNDENIYVEIVFGKPISFDVWIEYVKNGDVFFDSGMYQGNNRPYMQWRANNLFWDKLITEKYN